MYELIQAAKDSYYINCPAKIGVVKLDDSQVCLIDSGNDKDAGRKIRQILDQKGWQLTAIYNTHSNADHIGGNSYLQNHYGCKIFAPGIEAAFTMHPLLEPSFLYGGFPPKELRHKFLMAQESWSHYLTETDLPEGMTLIKLPGHFFDMAGFRTKDDVVYLADCLSSEETLKKYQISFIYDVEAYLNTLEKVKKMKGNLFIPAHAEATENIATLAQMNSDKVHEIASKILEICKQPHLFEEILQSLFNAFNLKMTFEQYVLVGSTLRSYLAWLKDTHKVDFVFKNSQMLWQTLVNAPK